MAVVAVLSMAAPVGADSIVGSAEVDALAAKGYSWQGWADARGVAPLFGIPHELQPATGFARTYVDSVPGSSAGFAGFAYGDEIVEEGILEIAPGGGQKNPTLSRCGNPGEHGTGGVLEFGGGGVGAKAVTDCKSQLKATGNSTTGPVVTDQLQVSSLFSDAKSTMTEGLIVGEATSRLFGIKAGDLSIESLMSWVKIEFAAEQEPKVSYKISAVGIRSGDEPALDAGAPGWSIGGSDVPASDVVTQFNTQANETGAKAAPDSQTWEVDLMAPRVYQPGDVPGRSFTDFSPINPDEIAVFAPFLRVRSNNYSCCKNASMENVGFNLALARVRNYIFKTNSSIGDKVLDGGYEAEDKTPINTIPKPAPSSAAAFTPVAAPAVSLSPVTPAMPAPAAPGRATDAVGLARRGPFGLMPRP